LRIFTSSWFYPLPASIQRVGISRGVPRRQPAGFRMMRELSPGPWFNSVSPTEYRRLYVDQLAALDAQAVLDKLYTLGEGRDVALLCFESPIDPKQWCHRGLVAGWLWDEMRIEVTEFDYGPEHGWAHPKVPAMWEGHTRQAAGGGRFGAGNGSLSK
jgi:hypothetical protein